MKRIPPSAFSARRLKKGERGIWPRRFWEHAMRDEGNYERHVDYLHYNPVKHGHVTRVADWPYSSFHQYLEPGIYNFEWPQMLMFGVWRWNDAKGGMRFAFPPYSPTALDEKVVWSNPDHDKLSLWPFHRT